MTDVAQITGTPTTPAPVLKRKALRMLGSLPPFSPILNRLMATLAGENISFSKLGDLIEKDTVVAGNLLHLVNSALYARRGTVNSVRHALSLLGVDKVRNAVLGISLTQMWNKVTVPRSFSIAEFDMHSAAAAILSDSLAQRLPVDYPEGAFVAGLLHDLGRLLIAMGLPEQFEMIQGPDRGASELEVLGFTHAELSAEALAVWNLPVAIQTAVLHHHDAVIEGVRPIPLSMVIATADQYVNSVSVSNAHGIDPGSSGTGVIAQLGLPVDQLATTLGEFKAEYHVMTQFFRQH
jgi:HD-like signal output (HDOD) protein